MNEIAWVMLAVSLVIIPLFSYFLTRRYSDIEQPSRLTVATAAGGLSLSLITIFLVPIDIYTVSANIDSSGFQKDADATANAGDVVKILYYILYGFLLAFAFAVMPFVYFWFEEEDEEDNTKVRVCGALKYTIAFIIIFGVLIALGVILKGGKFNSNGSQDDKWVDNLKGSFSAGDSIISFCVATLATLGLFGWIAYTAFGLATFPISLMRSRGNGLSREESRYSSEDVELNLRKTQAELEFLTSRYEVASRKWSQADKKQYQVLKRKEKRLQDMVSSRKSASAGVTDWFSKVWNALAPLRIIVGLALLGLSFLIVVSLILSSIDRAMHSECKFACGFSLSTPNVMNPIDLALTYFSTVFPMDYIAFGGVTLYIFLCSIAGLVSVGVRLLCWKLYDIEKRKSMPHGLIMGAWLLMFVVLLLNMELLTLAPRYVSFGNQFYLDETGARHDCDMAHVGYNYNGTAPAVCKLSQVANFVSSTTLALPFFGVIFYIANYVFFVTFLLSVVYAFCRNPHKAEYQQMHGDDD